MYNYTDALIEEYDKSLNFMAMESLPIGSRSSGFGGSTVASYWTKAIQEINNNSDSEYNEIKIGSIQPFDDNTLLARIG